MDLDIAPAAKLTVVYVAVLFYTVTKQFNVTNGKCGCTMNALITESQFDSVKNTNCTWICPKCD